MNPVPPTLANPNVVPRHFCAARAGVFLVLWSLVLGTLLPSAAGAQDARGVEFVPPAPREFDWAHFAGTASRHVRYAGPWAHITYGRFENLEGARAEFIYAVAVDGDHVVDIPFGLRRSLAQWRRIAGTVRDIGPEREAKGSRQRLHYRRFRTSPDGRACFAFMGEWNVRGLDRQARHGKAVFGYFCAAVGQSLTPAGIGLLLAQLQFRSADTVARRALPGGDSAALAFARSGAPRFPFDFARTVREGRGDRREK